MQTVFRGFYAWGPENMSQLMEKNVITSLIGKHETQNSTCKIIIQQQRYAKYFACIAMDQSDD